jgi:hypothetical protein
VSFPFHFRDIKKRSTIQKKKNEVSTLFDIDSSTNNNNSNSNDVQQYQCEVASCEVDDDDNAFKQDDDAK